MRKIAIFAHDAGGSELVLELLKASLHVGEFKVFCTNDSPCKRIIEQKNLTKFMQIIKPSKEIIFSALNSLDPDVILYTTSWQNHYEYHFLDYAKKHKILSMAFLDNWTNYRERFGYPANNWKNNFPDFIATHDEKNTQEAKYFDLANIVAIKNYSIINELRSFKKSKQNDTLLFLSEPTSKVAGATYGDANYWGFNEADVFKSILKHKEKFKCNKIVVRLHPSDKEDIYKKINPQVNISNSSLNEDIARSKIIIGIDSSVLYLAFLLGKKVISYMPSDIRKFHIPLPKSNQLKNLENINIDLLQLNDKDLSDFGIDFALFIKNTLG